MSEGAAGAELASSLQVVPGGHNFKNQIELPWGTHQLRGNNGEAVKLEGNTGRTSSCGAASGGMSDAASPGSVN